MVTPFRNDADALKTRLASIDEEVARLRAQAREYTTVQERLAQLEREADEVRREVEARSVRRTAPFLDTLKVASPCTERWDDMIGDERSRFCGKCQKDVHNVSALTRDEAEAFLESVASSVCVRMYQRSDGTVLTADCPVGVQRKRVKRLFLATLGGGLMAAAGAVAFWRYEEAETVMGELQAIPTPPTLDVPFTAPVPTFQATSTPPERREIMGAMPLPSVKKPPPAPLVSGQPRMSPKLPDQDKLGTRR